MLLNQIIGLRPALGVLLPGVFVDVTRCQLSERPSVTRGLTVGLRVLALGHLKHYAVCQPAGVRKADRLGIAQMVPAHAAVIRIDAFPRSGTTRLHRQREALLLCVPDQATFLNLPHIELSQLAFVARSGRRSISTWSRHGFW